MTRCAIAFAAAVASVGATTADVGNRRRLSYDSIAGYSPGSQVTDHNAIDLDQKAMEDALGETPVDYTTAEAIYRNGGNSKSYTSFTVPALTAAISKGTTITGYTSSGTAAQGKAYSSYAVGDTSIRMQYVTSDTQASYVNCQVGGLEFPNTAGCIATPTATLTISGYGSVNGTDGVNKNGRTIRGFSTGAAAKMYTCSIGCPYKDYAWAYNYYGDFDYGDKWVLAALGGTATGFATGGNADFSTSGSNDDATRTQCIKKGTVYLNIWMYVVREFEDALDDCTANCISCNDDPVHAWDEGVAFYTGSLEGTSGSSSGKLLHRLAEKRCANFKTCGTEGNALTGVAKVNYDLATAFALGQNKLQMGNCVGARVDTNRAIDLMTVPLIQGTLRYAYKMEFLQGAQKELAEGATFAAGCLPRLAYCSATDAATVYNNIRIGAPTTSFAAVKTAFENNYPCLNITCADVGGLWFSAQNSYYTGAGPCIDASTTPKAEELSDTAVIIIAISAAAAGLFALMMCYLIKMEKAGKPVFYGLQVKPGA